MTAVIVGIDLGTTCYSIATFSNNAVEPIRDFNESIRTPCYVSSTVTNIVRELRVGINAYTTEYSDKESLVVYEPKRLIGCEYEDRKVQALLQWLSYSVNKNLEDLEIVVQRGQHRLSTTPFDVYENILNYIKQCIKKATGKVLRIPVVLTVPPAFTLKQRTTTSTVARSADFEVLELLDEPTAIALTYFSKHEALKKGDYFLVYDLGASDFKIGLFKVISKSFECVCASSDTGISGQDFDIIIHNYICDELWRLLKFDVGKDKDTIRQLLIKSEIARRNLSEAGKVLVPIYLKNIPPCKRITLEISRFAFEEIAAHLFLKTVSIVDQFIHDLDISKDNIMKIILYGGLSRTPKIQQILIEHFGDKISNELVFEDSSVAEGAAIHAANCLKARGQQQSTT